jgi:CRP-like cAMP-binding protein
MERSGEDGEFSRSRGFYATLPPEVDAELLAAGRRVLLEPGTFAHRKGDDSDGLCRVLTGRIRLCTVNDDGRELVLADLTAGAIFGEVSLFDGLHRSHDALAVQRTEILVVSRERLDVILDKRPEVARYFLRALASKLRLSLIALETAALDDMPRRLAQRLLWLSAQHAVALAISQADLAAMVSATRQSVNKQLKKWEREGVVGVRGGRITVHDHAALESIARL